MTRYLQPPLLWGYFLKWCETIEKTEDLDNHPVLLIYVKNGKGAYYLHGPRLYWKDNAGDSHFHKVEPDILETNLDNLAEVEAFIYRQKGRNPKLWTSLADFINEIV